MIETQYVNRISGQLRNFKWQKYSCQANFSCPFCGDSKTNKIKSRGYLLTGSENKFYYFCHNCDTKKSFKSFLKELDSSLYTQFVAESFLEKDKPKKSNFDLSKKPEFSKLKLQYNLKIPSVNELSHHHVYKYLTSRKIPKRHFDRFFFTDNFRVWVESIVPGKYSKLINESRLVIPFFNDEGELFMAQGRSLDDSNKLRYITVKFDDESAKIYGRERWNPNEFTFVTEGPIDSLFFSNSLAVASSDLTLLENFLNPKSSCLVFDNEPRNKQIIQKMNKAISLGFNIFLWPEKLLLKDINDVVIWHKGWDVFKDDMDYFVKGRMFSGLQAQLKLNNWKRCN